MEKHSAAIAMVLSLAASLPAAGQSFTNGDIYLVSASLPKPVNSAEPGVVRIDPTTWTATRIYTGSSASYGRATYDAFRDRLVMRNSGSPSGLLLLAADGSTSTLPYSGAQDAVFPAATGDGRIYFLRSTNPPKLALVDSAGATHEVLQAGVQATTAMNTSAMHFHAPTGTLLIGSFGGTPFVHIERITLTPDGAGVAGRFMIDFALSSNGEIITGFSEGPDGSVFVKLDDNSNSTLSRMKLLDVSAMTMSNFASSGYFGCAGEIAGAYSATLGAAVVLDSLGDRLRVFGPGSSGEGTIVLTNSVSSVGGSGELAQLVPIVTRCIADFNNDGFPDAIDYDVFIAAWLSNSPSADVNHDEFVDAIDYDLFITHWVQGC